MLTAAESRQQRMRYSVAAWRSQAQDDAVALVEMVLRDLREAWSSALGDRLTGLYVHGSLVAGDFADERSDLDVLAVLNADPDENLLVVLAALHTDLDRRHPQWAGRIEVEYVSLDAVRGAAVGRTSRNHVIARISLGESLHLLPVTRHRVVTWSTVHDGGRCMLGPPAGTLLPAIGADLVRAALLDHVRDWPVWVMRMTAPGAQSYAVLTICRALQRLQYGRQLSKRRAADQTITVYPRWADLIAWARDWWYCGGQDLDVGHFDDVRRFVSELSATILASETSMRHGHIRHVT
jgi:hypothetical protein